MKKNILILLTAAALAAVLCNPEKLLDYSLKGYHYVHGIKFKQIKTDNFTIGYYYSDRKHKENVVLLHGLGAKAGSTWFNLLPELAGKYNVIAPDLLLANLVESGAADYSLDIDISLIRELMEKCQIKKASLVGLSVGGWLAAKIAASSPELCDKLVLIDSAGLGTARVLQTISASAHNDSFGKWFYTNIFYSPPPIPLFLLGPVFNDMDKLGPLCEDFLQNSIYTKQDLEGEAGNIFNPTLIIWGAQDRILPLEIGHEFNRLIKKSKLQILDKCGHAVVWDKREELSAVIDSFLQNDSSKAERKGLLE